MDQLSSRQISVTLSSEAVAGFVWLEAPGLRGRFSDNGFLMAEPTTTVVFIGRGDVTVEELRAKLEYRSFADVA